MKVLIVDDHPIVRAGLRRLLAAELRLDAVEAATARDAMQAFREARPEFVVLDLNLPDVSGIELLGRLRTEDPKVRVLVISMYDNPLYVARVLEAGARGYVSKNAPAEEILQAARQIAAGREYVDHETAQQLAFANHRTPLGQSRLRARDIEILRLLAEGGSLSEIAQALGISYKTVANHCTHLRAKLAMPRMADLIRFALSCRFSRSEPAVCATGEPDPNP